VRGIGSLVYVELFKHDKATLVTKTDLWEATIVVLSNVEQMLTERACQLFDRTIVAIWDDRRDVHTMLRPFSQLLMLGGKKT
jgi:hypothetical protein